jgi:hypothetical protein
MIGDAQKRPGDVGRFGRGRFLKVGMPQKLLDRSPLGRISNETFLEDVDNERIVVFQAFAGKID